MSIGQNIRSQESYLYLYKELYDHADFLEEAVVRMVHGRKVERDQLDSHLAQMAASIALSDKKHRLLKPLHPGRKNRARFHNDMVRATRIIRGQIVILLKTSFLVEKPFPGMDYIKTLSDLTTNIHGAFQHVVRSNVLMPIMMN